SLIEHPLLLTLVLAVVLLGKPLAAILVVRVLGRPMSTAGPVGAALSKVGEFSFILGVSARQLGVLGDAGWNALVGASILSIALNPTVYAFARRFTNAAPEIKPPPGRQ